MDPARHLTEFEIAGYLGGDLADADRRRVAAHLEACADCRAEVVAVHELATTFRRPIRSRWVRWALPVGLAAAIGAFALVQTTRPVEGPPQLERPGLNPTEATMALVPVKPAEGGVTIPLGATFVWRHLPAVMYRFTLLAGDGAPLWTAETADTTVVLPSEVRLGEGGYFWRVDAIRDGVTATTGVVRFSVAR